MNSARATRVTGSRCSPTRTADLPPLESGPGAHQAQAALKREAAHVGASARADHLRLDDPRRVAGLEHLDLLQPAAEEAAEGGIHLALRLPDAPSVVRREVVVRVLDRLEIGHRAGARERVLDALG